MAKSEKVSSTLMYVGDSCMSPIPLTKGQVFTSLPLLLEKAIAADPALGAQFMPLSDAAKALRRSVR